MHCMLHASAHAGTKTMHAGDTVQLLSARSSFVAVLLASSNKRQLQQLMLLLMLLLMLPAMCSLHRGPSAPGAELCLVHD